MIKTTAVNTVQETDFMITWSLGLRCNFDCTYCGDLRHTNDSPHSDLETLIKTYEFIKEWVNLYNQHSKNKKRPSIGFTGGEPTNNPHFWKLVEYIKKDNPDCGLGIVTNGSWGKKYLQHIIDYHLDVITSIHLEADPIIKQKVLDNLLALKQAGVGSSVNLMMHTDLWDDVLSTAEFLDSHGISYNPVPIGDGPNDNTNWRPDGRGVLRRTAHSYTAEQQEWFFKKRNIDPVDKKEKAGSKLGRECCGRCPLVGKVDGEWQPIRLINTEFKDWYCMVDWYFLHIDQESREVYHHQTCKARHDGTRGPVGYINDAEKLLADLAARLNSEDVKPIVCTLPRCGCGMCTPKAQDFVDFEEIWKSKTNIKVQAG